MPFLRHVALCVGRWVGVGCCFYLFEDVGEVGSGVLGDRGVPFVVLAVAIHVVD